MAVRYTQNVNCKQVKRFYSDANFSGHQSDEFINDLDTVLVWSCYRQQFLRKINNRLVN